MQLIIQQVATGFQTPNGANLPLNDSGTLILAQGFLARLKNCNVPFYSSSVHLWMKCMYEIQPNPQDEKQQECVIGKTILDKIKSISMPVIPASESIAPIQSYTRDESFWNTANRSMLAVHTARERHNPGIIPSEFTDWNICLFFFFLPALFQSL